jgi:O-antigen/teichoic acid export membrane protein
LLIANSIRNFAGAAIPAAASLLTVPYIVKAMGDERYGAFTLIAAIIGYFALLDINVTAGAVKYIAEYNASGRRRELHEVIIFGGMIYLVIGVIGSFAIFILSGTLTERVFAVSAQHRALVTSALQLAALGFLFSQLQLFLNSITQSLNRFDISAILEIVFGTAVPITTVVLLWSGYGLWEIVALRVVATVVNVVLLLLIIIRIIPDFHWVLPSSAIARKLASFSCYSYLSRIAAITYANADKLLIGAMVSVAELTYYAIPATIANRLLGLTFRMGSVFYPLASELNALGQHEKLEQCYLTASRYLNYINIYFVMIISLFAYQILFHWMGAGFAEKGEMIMIAISLSMLVDSFTNLPSLFNDGLGFPKMTGVFAVVRAIGGLGLTVFFTYWWGIFGAALSHLIASAIFSALFLIFIHQRTVPVPLWRLLRYAYIPPAMIAVLSGCVYFGLSRFQPQNLAHVLLSACFVTLLYLLLGLMMILEPGHKQMINQRWHLFWGQEIKAK